jgi:hypothetical protein
MHAAIKATPAMKEVVLEHIPVGYNEDMLLAFTSFSDTMLLFMWLRKLIFAQKLSLSLVTRHFASLAA